MKISDDSLEEATVYLMYGFFFLILPALSVGIGSIFHSLKGNSGGLVAIIFGGAVLIIFFRGKLSWVCGLVRELARCSDHFHSGSFGSTYNNSCLLLKDDNP